MDAHDWKSSCVCACIYGVGGGTTLQGLNLLGYRAWAAQVPALERVSWPN